MSAYRKLTERLKDEVDRKRDTAYRWQAVETGRSWSRTLALLEDELRAMGDDE